MPHPLQPVGLLVRNSYINEPSNQTRFGGIRRCDSSLVNALLRTST
jgi:hypothetical protein